MTGTAERLIGVRYGFVPSHIAFVGAILVVSVILRRVSGKEYGIKMEDLTSYGRISLCRSRPAAQDGGLGSNAPTGALAFVEINIFFMWEAGRQPRNWCLALAREETSHETHSLVWLFPCAI